MRKLIEMIKKYLGKFMAHLKSTTEERVNQVIDDILSGRRYI